MYFSGFQKEFSRKGAYEKPSAREGHSQQHLRAGNRLAWAGSAGKALGWSMSDVQGGQGDGARRTMSLLQGTWTSSFRLCGTTEELVVRVSSVCNLE